MCTWCYLLYWWTIQTMQKLWLKVINILYFRFSIIMMHIFVTSDKNNSDHLDVIIKRINIHYTKWIGVNIEWTKDIFYISMYVWI